MSATSPFFRGVCVGGGGGGGGEGGRGWGEVGQVRHQLHRFDLFSFALISGMRSSSHRCFTTVLKS